MSETEKQEIQKESRLLADLVKARQADFGKFTRQEFLEQFSEPVLAGDIVAFRWVLNNWDRNPSKGNSYRKDALVPSVPSDAELMVTGHPGDFKWVAFSSSAPDAEIRLLDGTIDPKDFEYAFGDGRRVNSLFEVFPPISKAEYGGNTPSHEQGVAYRAFYQTLCELSDHEKGPACNEDRLSQEELAHFRKYQSFFDLVQIAQSRELVRLTGAYADFRKENEELCVKADGYFTRNLKRPTIKTVRNPEYDAMIEAVSNDSDFPNGIPSSTKDRSGNFSAEYAAFLKKYGRQVPLWAPGREGKDLNPEWYAIAVENGWCPHAQVTVAFGEGRSKREFHYPNPVWDAMKRASGLQEFETIEVGGKPMAVVTKEFQEWKSKLIAPIPTLELDAAKMRENHERLPEAERLRMKGPKPVWTESASLKRRMEQSIRTPAPTILEPEGVAKVAAYDEKTSELGLASLPEGFPEEMKNAARYDHYLRHRSMDAVVAENFGLGASSAFSNKSIFKASELLGLRPRDLGDYGFLRRNDEEVWKDSHNWTPTSNTRLMIPTFTSSGRFVAGYTTREVVPSHVSIGADPATISADPKYKANSTATAEFADGRRNIPRISLIFPYSAADALGSHPESRATSVAFNQDGSVLEINGGRAKGLDAHLGTGTRFSKLISDLGSSKQILLCEGQIDAIASTLMGVPGVAFAGVSRATASQLNGIFTRLPGATAMTFPDADISLAGQLASYRYSAGLPYMACVTKANPSTLPGQYFGKFKDVNDVLSYACASRAKDGAPATLTKEALTAATKIYESAPVVGEGRFEPIQSRVASMLAPELISEPDKCGAEAFGFMLNQHLSGQGSAVANPLAEFFSRKRNAATICSVLSGSGVRGLDGGWKGPHTPDTLAMISDVFGTAEAMVSGTGIYNAKVANYVGRVFTEVARRANEAEKHIPSSVPAEDALDAKRAISDTLREIKHASRQMETCVEVARESESWVAAANERRARESTAV